MAGASVAAEYSGKEEVVGGLRNVAGQTEWVRNRWQRDDDGGGKQGRSD